MILWLLCYLSYICPIQEENFHQDECLNQDDQNFQAHYLGLCLSSSAAANVDLTLICKFGARHPAKGHLNPTGFPDNLSFS